MSQRERQRYHLLEMVIGGWLKFSSGRRPALRQYFDS